MIIISGGELEAKDHACKWFTEFYGFDGEYSFEDDFYKQGKSFQEACEQIIRCLDITSFKIIAKKISLGENISLA